MMSSPSHRGISPDPEYPRPRWIGGLRWVLRFWWLAFALYFGNAVFNVISLIAQGSPLNYVNISNALLLSRLIPYMQAQPVLAIPATILAITLIGAGRWAHRDQEREREAMQRQQTTAAAQGAPSPQDVQRIRKAGSGLRNPRLYEFLKWRYASEPILVRCGEIYPLAVYPAPELQQELPDSVLQHLTKRQQPDEELRPQRATYRELLHRMGRPLQDRTTFTMQELSVDGRLGLSCELGTYYRALDTCDSLEWEILNKAQALTGSTVRSFKAFEKHLPLRVALHSLVDNPVRTGTHRSAAIAVSTLVAYQDSDAIYLMLRKRSAKGVAVHAGLVHVIPSFMFQPATVFMDEEFSVTHNVYREYLEEIFNRPEPEDAEGDWRYFYGDPRLQYLQQLIKAGQAQLYLSGLAVNLLNLRPEICTVLLIRSPEWSARHAQASREEERFHFNIEWATVFDSADNVADLIGRVPFSVEATDEDLIQHASLHPDRMVPPGAAAFWLGVDLLRRVIPRQGIAPSDERTRQSRSMDMA